MIFQVIVAYVTWPEARLDGASPACRQLDLASLAPRQLVSHQLSNELSM